MIIIIIIIILIMMMMMMKIIIIMMLMVILIIIMITIGIPFSVQYIFSSCHELLVSHKKSNLLSLVVFN